MLTRINMNRIRNLAKQGKATPDQLAALAEYTKRSADDNSYRMCIDCGANSPQPGSAAGDRWIETHECPTPGEFEKWLNDPVAMAEYRATINITYAEMAKKYGSRDMMIYEMYNLSQYADGSVLNAMPTTINPWRTLTAQEVVDGKAVIQADRNSAAVKTAKDITADLLRNAKAALKNGSTTNLAPRA
jgi:hypothetical protein